MNKNLLLLSFSIGVLLVGCSPEPANNKMPALFDTKLEAEQAAENFNCSGAHKMGNKWMPCNSHDFHEEFKKNSDHEHHHHH